MIHIIASIKSVSIAHFLWIHSQTKFLKETEFWTISPKHSLGLTIDPVKMENAMVFKMSLFIFTGSIVN